MTNGTNPIGPLGDHWISGPTGRRYSMGETLSFSGRSLRRPGARTSCPLFTWKSAMAFDYSGAPNPIENPKGTRCPCSALVAYVPLYVAGTSVSPSPRPSPLGRGRTIGRPNKSRSVSDWRQNCRQSPLSPRAGVRGNGTIFPTRLRPRRLC